MLGKFHEKKSLTDYSPWGCKELDMTQSLNNNNNKTILQGSNHIITGLEAGAEDMGKSYG